MLYWVTAISDKNTLSNKHLCCTELLRYNRLISVFNTIIFYFVKNIIFYFVKNIFFLSSVHWQIVSFMLNSIWEFHGILSENQVKWRKNEFRLKYGVNVMVGQTVT